MRGKCILGFPKGASHMDYIVHVNSNGEFQSPIVFRKPYKRHFLGWGTVYLREGGEVEVPLRIWNMPAWREWIASLKAAGNRLDAAKVLWSGGGNTKKGGENNVPFAYCIWVKVWINGENRYKENEVVFGRGDVYHGVGICLDERENLNSKVVLVKEFRSPGKNRDGYVHETPGGSNTSGKEGKGVAAEGMERRDWG